MIKNVALASLVAASAVMAQQQADSSQLHIDTPNGPVACQPTRITWGGGQPPYYVTILKGGESSGTPLADLTGGTPTDETQLTWWVNLEPGTSITATIKDSTGAQNSAAKVDVASGGNTDCIQKPLSVSIAGAMATPSGSSNGETPQATDGGNQGGDNNNQGGGAVGGGNTGGDQQQSQGGGDQQPSATPSGGDQSQSAAPSGGDQSQSAGGDQSQSAAPTSSAGGAEGASSSAASQQSAASSTGNAASSASSGASAAGSAAQSAASNAASAAPGGGSGASALVPGFVAPALAAVVAAFAL